MESIKDIISIKSKLFCKREKSNKNYNKLSQNKGKLLNRSTTNIFKQEEKHINNLKKKKQIYQQMQRLKETIP